MEKMNKIQKFEMVKAYVENGSAEMSVTEMIEFLQAQIDLEQKRKDNKKPTKIQEENKVLAEKVYNVLVDAATPMTVTKIVETLAIPGLSTQKITPILTAFVGTGKVTKDKDKKSTVYSAVVTDSEDSEE